jgi:hypothetical protein
MVLLIVELIISLWPSALKTAKSQTLRLSSEASFRLCNCLGFLSSFLLSQLRTIIFKEDLLCTSSVFDLLYDTLGC